LIKWGRRQLSKRSTLLNIKLVNLICDITICSSFNLVVYFKIETNKILNTTSATVLTSCVYMYTALSNLETLSPTLLSNTLICYSLYFSPTYFLFAPLRIAYTKLALYFYNMINLFWELCWIALGLYIVRKY